jgi:hypothetical protein
MLGTPVEQADAQRKAQLRAVRAWEEYKEVERIVKSINRKMRRVRDTPRFFRLRQLWVDYSRKARRRYDRFTALDDAAEGLDIPFSTP